VRDVATKVIRRQKQSPSLRSDAAAARFVANADLTRYDLSGFKPMRFDIEPTAALHMRLPRSLLDAVKSEARARGIPTPVMCACYWRKRSPEPACGIH
jgi:predicted DNA binding CopG/RHH family protein